MLWLSVQGLVLEHSGEMTGYLWNPNSWPCAGTEVSFNIESSGMSEKYSVLYTGSAGLHDRLVPFARTGADGSEAAFWLDDRGVQRIVHLGSGSGSALCCLLGNEPLDFLRLLAVGYGEICWLDLDTYDEPPFCVDGGSSVNGPFRDWLLGRQVSVPVTASEVVRYPAQMGDGLGSSDVFCRWLTSVCS